MKLNVVDFFSDCGGLSKGFEEAGFNILLGIDNDKDALATFEKNHDNSKSANIDLSNKDFLKDIDNIINNNRFFYINRNSDFSAVISSLLTKP